MGLHTASGSGAGRVAVREYRSQAVASGPLTGSEMEFELQDVPEGVWLLGGYLVVDGTPASTGNTDGLSCSSSALGNGFALGTAILDKTGAVAIGPGHLILGSEPVTLWLTARIGADEPGDLADIEGLTSITVVLLYVPVSID